MKIRLKPQEKNREQQELKKEPPLAEGITLCVIVLMMILFGLSVLYSTSYGIVGSNSYYFLRQIQWGVVGFLGFGAAIFFGYKKLSNWSWILMIGICLLLVVALLFPPINGARRWIQLPGIGSIQPSEYAKVILALFLAKLCSDKIKMVEAKPFKFFCIAFLFSAPVLLLVYAGKDLGTTVLLGVIFGAMLFIAGVRLIYLITPPIVLIPLGIYKMKLSGSYRWQRIITFLNPEFYQKDEGYQLWLSILALGSGSWTGVGFTESRMKHKYLPEAHTDFILSIVGEELGYVWMCLVIFAYIVFLALAIAISMRARTRQGMFLVFGLATFITAQAIVNIGVISAAFPTKGMPAPFISYGGSSLVSCMTATGLIVSVALDAAYPEYNEWLRKKILAFLSSLNIFSKKETRSSEK
ncbi:MAG: cell division protein FtsW [Lentisphaeria bacterium]|nr:cell division protein FtsW [Lentisphaeria bacterium]